MGMLRRSRNNKRKFYFAMDVDKLAAKHGGAEALWSHLDEMHGEALDARLEDNTQPVVEEQPHLDIKLALTVGEMRLGADLLDASTTNTNIDPFVLAITRAIVGVGGDWSLYHQADGAEAWQEWAAWDRLEWEQKLALVGTLAQPDATELASAIGRSTEVTAEELRNLT